MNIYRGFLLLIAILSAIGSAYFGSVEIYEYQTITYSAANGGAIGLGVLSGMCFIAISITFIGKEEK
ncbi:hypothetical protein [uncultured Kordia sp.]|uniref:hypothetical protein n=1 Tax=uncultured Kordia sp. TaxID=507699 RepID=UPI00262C6897|nr:hypothetical protein [uncultured Kordia sp.]